MRDCRLRALWKPYHRYDQQNKYANFRGIAGCLSINQPGKVTAVWQFSLLRNLQRCRLDLIDHDGFPVFVASQVTTQDAKDFGRIGQARPVTKVECVFGATGVQLPQD